jgi:hypothetical protein
MGVNVQSAEVNNFARQTLDLVNSTQINQNIQAICTTGAGNTLSIVQPAEPFCEIRDINVNQTATSTCTSIITANADLTSTVKNDIIQSIKQVAESDQASEQGFLALAASLQNTRLNQNLSTDAYIENLFEVNVDNVCEGIATSYNNGELIICRARDININQDAFATARAECASTILAKVFNDTTALQEADQAAKVKQSSLQTGLAIGLGIIILIIIVIIIIYFATKKKPASK